VNPENSLRRTKPKRNATRRKTGHTSSLVRLTLTHQDGLLELPLPQTKRCL
jgi:hypothetical protein